MSQEISKPDFRLKISFHSSLDLGDFDREDEDIEEEDISPTRPTPDFEIGDPFCLSEGALEIFGRQYAGILFTVKQWYDHFVSDEDKWNGDEDPHGDVGFDETVECCLYDTTFEESLLYECEMMYVPPRPQNKLRYTQLALF